MKKLIIAILAVISFVTQAQNKDSVQISRIFKNALSDTSSYHNLRILTSAYPGRLAGTAISLESVKWAEKILKNMGADSVWLQECRVRHWERGPKEIAKVVSDNKSSKEFSVCAIGGSVGTGQEGIKAQIIEVRDYDELKKLGKDNVKGKILFINHPADPGYFNPFDSYGSVAAYRVRGANQASYYGAVAMIDRSATPVIDDNPHTGIMHYADTVKRIPAFCISTKDADVLSTLLKKEPDTRIFIRSECRELPETVSYNVVGQLKGSEKPNEIIAFGGHIDCWDNCQGAHDDGAGVVQTIDVLRIFKDLDLKPKHTIRVVVFMDEEMEQKGSKAYAEAAAKEKHIAAIESDRGGFAPQGFSIDADDSVIKKVQSWKNLLEPYGLWSLEKGGSGVDVRELKKYNVPLFGFVPDAQRYFDYHHSPNDTFDKINLRELQLGSAAISSFVWLIDTYGLQ